MADPGAYTKEELASLHSQILSNLEQAWELLGGSEEQLLSTMIQISQVVAQPSVTGHLHPELTKANTATSFALIQLSGRVSIAASALADRVVSPAA